MNFCPRLLPFSTFELNFLSFQKNWSLPPKESNFTLLFDWVMLLESVQCNFIDFLFLKEIAMLLLCHFIFPFCFCRFEIWWVFPNFQSFSGRSQCQLPQDCSNFLLLKLQQSIFKLELYFQVAFSLVDLCYFDYCWQLFLLLANFLTDLTCIGEFVFFITHSWLHQSSFYLNLPDLFL